MPANTNHDNRVTIVTPVYNAGRYIETCIGSVLAQTFTKWEQVVVDDGSTDDTEQRVRSYADPRIRYVRLPHRGLSSLAETYNAALAASRCDLVAVLEGDDLWHPQKLQLQVALFNDSETVISWGRATIIGGDDTVSRRWPVPRAFRRDLSMPELFRVLARWNVLSPALTVMLRRGALDRIGGFQQTGSRLLVDLPTWLMIAATARGTARYVNADVGHYRIHGNNTGILHNSLMRIEHHEVFTAIRTKLGPAALQRLGWSEDDERTNLASASATRGVAYFQQGERAQARSAFREAMRRTRSPREYLTAAIGYVSALTGVNVIGAAQKVRASAATLMRRVEYP